MSNTRSLKSPLIAVQSTFFSNFRGSRDQYGRSWEGPLTTFVWSAQYYSYLYNNIDRCIDCVNVALICLLTADIDK